VDVHKEGLLNFIEDRPHLRDIMIASASFEYLHTAQHQKMQDIVKNTLLVKIAWTKNSFHNLINPINLRLT